MLWVLLTLHSLQSVPSLCGTTSASPAAHLGGEVKPSREAMLQVPVGVTLGSKQHGFHEPAHPVANLSWFPGGGWWQDICHGEQCWGTGLCFPGVEKNHALKILKKVRWSKVPRASFSSPCDCCSCQPFTVTVYPWTFHPSMPLRKEEWAKKEKRAQSLCRKHSANNCGLGQKWGSY